MLIIFEGVVGSGKTTQSKKLVDYLKQRFPKKTVIWTREPGGCEIAEAIRKVVQATKFEEEMEPICEAYLYAAARAQSLRSVVKPVLDEGGIVVMDRSFITSLSFQGFGRGLGLDTVLTINETAIKGFKPNLVIYLKTGLKHAVERSFDKSGDKFESLDLSFFEKAEKGYLKIARHPLLKNQWVEIDGHGTISEVFERILYNIDTKLKKIK